MNDTILFSALQDMQHGLFNHKQSAAKENRSVYSFTLLAKVVDTMRARRLLADLMKRQPAKFMASLGMGQRVILCRTSYLAENSKESRSPGC
jgi:hypothetical protein